MTDLEFMAWQHRVITHMAGCTCNLPWKHAEPQPQCERCIIIAAYIERTKNDNKAAN